MERGFQGMSKRIYHRCGVVEMFLQDGLNLFLRGNIGLWRTDMCIAHCFS
jgi:hypothetical protein